MLEINTLRDDREKVIEGLQKRNLAVDISQVIDQILTLDDRRKLVQTNMDEELAQVNAKSKEIGNLFKSGKQSDAGELKNQVAGHKTSIKELESQLNVIMEDLQNAVIDLPNIPHQSVPKGLGANDNEQVKD